jgi:tetratricopeptide (TPR) repeat protein
VTARVLVGVAILFPFLASFDALSAHAEDPREVAGRALFVKGEYERALDIYANLFAETGDPLYLRNVGRCYQKLKRPEKAIDAFRDYLRRARIKPAERQEIEGFIQEMKELQAQQAAAAAAAAPANTGAVAAAPAPTLPPAPPSPSPSPAPRPGTVLTGAEASRADQEQEPGADSVPITRRWWFWTGIGAVVVAGVVTAVVLSRGGDGNACREDFCGGE